MAKQVINNGDSGLEARDKINENYTELYDRDFKSKVSVDDSVANYLEQKLVAGTNITLSINNPGGNETITINGIEGQIKISASDTTGDYLNPKITATGGIKTIVNPGGNEVLDLKFTTLYQPDGTNPFVYTDNGGALHIDGDIIQSGSSYETHVEQIYTKKDLIITRDGAVGGLGVGEYTGIQASLYDGANSGQLVFDKDGWARVGDTGSLVKLAGIEETPTDNGVSVWDSASSTLITSSGLIFDGTNLGVGTDSPFTLLTNSDANYTTGSLNSDGFYWGSDGAGYSMIVKNATLNGPLVRFEHNGGTGLAIRDTNSGTWELLVTDGKVGMGQAVGTEMLEVADNVKADSFIIR